MVFAAALLGTVTAGSTHAQRVVYDNDLLSGDLLTRGGSMLYDRTTSQVGTVRGTVQQLDFQRGQIAIRSDGQVVRLHARPQDLAGLNPGDVAGLTYLDYDGMLWLEPGGSFGDGYAGYGLDSFAISGEVTGTIQSVDRKTGRVKLADQTLRAHPEQLDGLYPGAFISLSYAKIGAERWVEGLGGTWGNGWGTGTWDGRLGDGVIQSWPSGGSGLRDYSIP